MRQARDTASQVAIRHGQELGARAVECVRSWALRHGTGRCDTARRGAQTGARHRRWARDLGVLLGCGLCTWCTQPVFDPV